MTHPMIQAIRDTANADHHAGTPVTVRATTTDGQQISGEYCGTDGHSRVNIATATDIITVHPDNIAGVS